MKSNTFNLLIVLLTIFFVSLSSRCKESLKKPRTLPRISSNGAGTFGCIIEGKIWYPDDKRPRAELSYQTYSKYSKKKGNFRIRAGKPIHFSMNGQTLYRKLSFEYLNITKEGLYYTKETQNNTGQYYKGFYYRDRPNPGYSSNSNSYGWIRIHKLDTINKIIAGTFSLNAIKVQDSTTTHFNDTLRITKGRFDLKYE